MNPFAIGAGVGIVAFLLSTGVKKVEPPVRAVYHATVVAVEDVGKAVTYPFRKLFRIL